MRVHVSSPEEGTVYEGRWGVEVVSTDGDAILTFSAAPETIIEAMADTGSGFAEVLDFVTEGILEVYRDPDTVRDFGDDLGGEMADSMDSVAEAVEEVREEILSEAEEEQNGGQ